jgi:hypothetical protein
MKQLPADDKPVAQPPPHSQQETRRIAELISEKCETIWPVSWKELMK